MQNLTSEDQIIASRLETLVNWIGFDVKLLVIDSIAPIAKFFLGSFKEPGRDVCKVILSESRALAGAYLAKGFQDR